MIKNIFLFFLCALMFSGLSARRLLSGHNLDQGEWVLIGVSLHNYELLPLQEELGTFIIKDKKVIKEIQWDWEFEEVYEDFCDFHYAFKLYHNGELIETLRANLLCNYITIGGLSYQFSKDDLLRYKSSFQTIKWSRIRFKDLNMLKIAVKTLDDQPAVYWYGDVQQYNFDGSFITQLDGQKWNANRDSLEDVVFNRVSKQLGSDEFYVATHYWILSDDFEHMNIKFRIFCDKKLYEDYASKFKYKDNDVVLGWRSHFSEQSFVQLVVVGMNKKEYFKMMGQF